LPYHLKLRLMFLLDPQHLLILGLLHSDQGLFDLVDLLPV
jgi:hypothetical protein